MKVDGVTYRIADWDREERWYYPPGIGTAEGFTAADERTLVLPV